MTAPEDLHAGVDVYSQDGKKLGTLHRAVLRRGDLSVTHIVVDTGFLRSGHAIWEGGLGLEYDRILPIGAVETTSDERVRLRLTADEFKSEPEYTDESFEQPHDLTPNEFDIPDVVNRLQGVAAVIGSTPGFWIVERLNKAVDEVDVKEGTPVWRREPHDRIGEVDRILLDPTSRRTIAFVIRRGFLGRHEVVLPVRYVAEIFDDLIHVDIPDAELDQLRPFAGG